MVDKAQGHGVEKTDFTIYSQNKFTFNFWVSFRLIQLLWRSVVFISEKIKHCEFATTLTDLIVFTPVHHAKMTGKI